MTFENARRPNFFCVLKKDNIMISRGSNTTSSSYEASGYHIDDLEPWIVNPLTSMPVQVLPMNLDPCTSTLCEPSLFIIIDNFNNELQVITELHEAVKIYYNNNFDENDAISFIRTKGNLTELNQIMSSGLTQDILTKNWKKINVMIVASIIPYGNYPLFHSTSLFNSIYLNDIIGGISKLFKNSPINASALVHPFGDNTETSQKGLPQTLKSVLSIVYSPNRVTLENIIKDSTHQIVHGKKISTLKNLFHHGNL